MIVFVGASASGKTELAKLLYKNYDYKKCITTTTRAIRNNEKQGVDYHFVDKQTFLNLQAKNEFVEATYYQQNLYGIQKKDVILNGVVIVDPSGANALIEEMGQEVFVVYVETNVQLRKARMIERGDQEQTIKDRLFLDDLIFDTDTIQRINLHVKNEDHSLFDLATQIHNAYQLYLKSIHNVPLHSCS